ncbi:MAG: hypothetical protein ACD_62C00026G0002 [uncultured bacterium]|nr:MAG: hypothetical protein ACD_62C00026G0002 [uncultured bacterium]
MFFVKREQDLARGVPQCVQITGTEFTYGVILSGQLIDQSCVAPSLVLYVFLVFRIDCLPLALHIMRIEDRCDEKLGKPIQGPLKGIVIDNKLVIGFLGGRVGIAVTPMRFHEFGKIIHAGVFL